MKNKLSLNILLGAAFVFLLPVVALANTSGYAWSESVGYFDFQEVSVSAEGLHGYAYNDNTGFLNVDGVSNDGTGILSGYAWSESVGYFDFQEVIISDGHFSGYAYNDNTGFLNMDGVSTTWGPATPPLIRRHQRRFQRLQTKTNTTYYTRKHLKQLSHSHSTSPLLSKHHQPSK